MHIDFFLQQWLARQGLEAVEWLGRGTEGYVVLLSNGHALKVTFDDTEIACLEYLEENQLNSPHLPRVFDYGELPNGSYFIIREVFNPLPQSLLESLPLSPAFMRDRSYVRNQTSEVEAFYKQAEDAIEDIRSLGATWSDLDWIHNWGMRDDGTLVMFDVSCRD